MSWHARLELAYRRDGARCIVHDLHQGPLRVLASLYPEGPAVCHNVLVHPPAGIVGGDVLDLGVSVAAGAHALITTPGASRFYRSAGDTARQSVHARVAPGARLEWLPQETICRRGALAHNHLRFDLEPGAEMIGWDVLALGLPASGEDFDQGCYTQAIELPGVWLERALIDGRDRRLLDSPLGWARHRVLATLWMAAGSKLEGKRRESLLEAARECTAADPLQPSAGSTSPHDELVLLRVLAPRVEPALQLLNAVWARWRSLAWQLLPCPPRVWRT